MDSETRIALAWPARALSWKTAADNGAVADEITAAINAGFDGMKRRRNEELRQRKEVEELAKKARPIKVARFEV